MFRVIPTAVLLAILLTNVMVITAVTIGMLIAMYVHCPNICVSIMSAPGQNDYQSIHPPEHNNPTQTNSKYRSASSKSKPSQ